MGCAVGRHTPQPVVVELVYGLVRVLFADMCIFAIIRGAGRG